MLMNEMKSGLIFINTNPENHIFDEFYIEILYFRVFIEKLYIFI